MLKYPDVPPPVLRPENFLFQYLCASLIAAYLYLLFESGDISFLTDFWYLIFLFWPLSVASMIISISLPGPAGLVISMFGLLALLEAASQFVLLLFSAKSVLCYFIVLQVVSLPFVVSTLLNRTVPEPQFAFTLYAAFVLGVLIGLPYLCPAFCGVCTPAACAVFVSAINIYNKKLPWSAASAASKRYLFLCAVVVAITGLCV